MVVGRIPFLVGCWPEAALGSLLCGLFYKPERESANKRQVTISCLLITEELSPSLYSVDSLASTHSRGGSYTGAQISRGKDNWGPS